MSNSNFIFFYVEVAYSVEVDKSCFKYRFMKGLYEQYTHVRSQYIMMEPLPSENKTFPCHTTRKVAELTNYSRWWMWRLLSWNSNLIANDWQKKVCVAALTLAVTDAMLVAQKYLTNHVMYSVTFFFLLIKLIHLNLNIDFHRVILL